MCAQICSSPDVFHLSKCHHRHLVWFRPNLAGVLDFCPFLSILLASDPSANSVGSLYKMYPQFHHFSLLACSSWGFSATDANLSRYLSEPLNTWIKVYCFFPFKFKSPHFDPYETQPLATSLPYYFVPCSVLLTKVHLSAVLSSQTEFPYQSLV